MMSNKDRLNQITHCEVIMEQRYLELQSLEEYKTSGRISAERYEQIKSSCDSIIKECQEQKTELVRVILALEDERFRKILYLYYVGHMKLSDIASTLGYSKDHTNRLHVLGLKALQF